MVDDRARDSTHRVKRFSRRVLAVVLLLVVSALYATNVHHFLAVNRPVGGEVLVVEAWIDDPATLEGAAKTILGGRYRTVVCVAVDESAAGGITHADDASQVVTKLVDLGVPPHLLHALRVEHADLDRTYSSALAVRTWLQRERIRAPSLDVFTIGVHARKSWLLYRQAFEPQTKVGIISGPHSQYPSNRWWLSGRGVYLVARNTVGYVYALVRSALASAVA
jgi:hypothetical protein